MLLNGDRGALTATQVAAHLGINVWNVVRDLKLGQRGDPNRLRGTKKPGVGRGGQWRIERAHYLDHLGIPAEDRTHLGPDGLPELLTLEKAASDLGLDAGMLRTLIRQQRWPHIAFGRQRYLTHHQCRRIRVALDEDLRQRRPAEPPGAVTSEKG